MLHSFDARRAPFIKKIVKDLDRYFKDKTRDGEQRRKAAESERLLAMKTNDEDTHLELLRVTKGHRLIQVILRTDAYFAQIDAQVERLLGGSKRTATMACC